MATRVAFRSTTGPRLAGLLDLPEGRVRGWESSRTGSPWARTRRPPHGSARGSPLRASACSASTTSGSATPTATGGTAHSRTRCPTPSGPLNSWPIGARASTFSWGTAFGGAAVIAAAGQVPRLKAVVTIGAPAEPRHVERNYDALVDRVLAEGKAEWLVGGRALTLKRTFVEDVRKTDLRDRIRQLGMPLLVMHSPTDNTVNIDNASDIFRAARHPRSFIALEGSDHLLTTSGQARRAARIISAWADQYPGLRHAGCPDITTTDE